MKIYRRAKKQILAAALTLVAAFAWSMDTSFQQLVKTATPWEIRAAIKRGADVNARDVDSWTPLVYAVVFNGNPDVIKTLLDAGADVKSRDEDRKTAFDYEIVNKQL